MKTYRLKFSEEIVVAAEDENTARRAWAVSLDPDPEAVECEETEEEPVFWAHLEADGGYFWDPYDYYEGEDDVK